MTTTIRIRHRLTTTWLLLIVLHSILSATCSFIIRKSNGIWTLSTSPSLFHFNRRNLHVSPLSLLRGGSTTSYEDEEDEVDSEDESESENETEDKEEDEEEVEEEEENVENPLDTVISSEPLQVTVKTNLGSALVDTSLELLVSRSRNVGSIKKNLSRQMPGRPPISAQRLVLDGRVLDDDLLVDELVVDDDEEDDEEEASNSLSLILDIVPPVDPKFATDHYDRIKDLSTSDILDAYAANAAAMYHNSQLLLRPEEEQGQVNLQLRQEAHDIREQLLQSMPESVTEVLETTSGNDKEEVALRPRGQRQRTGRGGASRSVKRVVQRNLNINWPDTIRNFLLFLFFGLFGGRNTISKHLLLLGAPLCFLLQARPVKIWLKQLFYCCKNPPSILLSLLSAPQQAILSFNDEQSKVALYGHDDDSDNDTAQREEVEDDDEESDDEYDEDEYDLKLL